MSPAEARRYADGRCTAARRYADGYGGVREDVHRGVREDGRFDGGSPTC